MADLIAVNTGPLIALARADALEVLEALPWTFICPPQVRAELDAGTTHGHPKVEPEGLIVEPLRKKLDPFAQVTLDVGEAAVIQLAQEQDIERVCIDERKGRRVARGLGLQVTGTLGLLLRAKTLGNIPLVKPYVETLRANGYRYHTDVVRKFLKTAGE